MEKDLVVLSHIKRVKVFANQLEVGMFVSDIDRDWSETSFLLQGFTLQDQEDVQSVQKQCEYVYIDFSDENDYKQFRAKTTVSKTLKEQYDKELSAASIKAEIRPATKAYKHSKGVIKGVLDRVMLGENFEIAAVKKHVKECVDSIVRNQNAMLMMTLIVMTH